MVNGPVSASKNRPSGPLLVIEGAPGACPLSVEQAQIEAEFRRCGAILLRGFALDVETFRRFAERLCVASVFNESRNRAVLDAASNIQSVDLGTNSFPLHPELAREPWRPDVCLFACLEAPKAGGETTFCDGVEIVRRLPLHLVNNMLQRGLLYRQPATPEALEFWLGVRDPDAEQLANPPAGCPYLFAEIDGRIVRCFSRPFLHKPMFCDEPAFGNFLLFARLALGVRNFPLLDDGEVVPSQWVDAVCDAAGPITYALQWQQGDILIVDNSRFMHGRRRILDASERKIASYFGYVAFAPPSEYDSADAPWRSGPFRPPTSAAGPPPSGASLRTV